MSKVFIFIIILISLLLHSTILKIYPFSMLNVVLILVLLMYEKFDLVNSILISLLLLGFGLIDITKSIGLVILQYSVTFIISETLFKLITKRNLKLVNLGDLVVVTLVFYVFELLYLIINQKFYIDNIVIILLSFVINTLITILLLNLLNSKRKNRLEIPRSH